MNLTVRAVLRFFLLIANWNSFVEGLNILVFVPGFSNSHVLFNYRFSAALAAKGHSVTLWNMLDLPLKNTNLNPPEGVEEFRVVIDFSTRNLSGTLSVMDQSVFKELGFKDYKKIVEEYRLRFRTACEMQVDEEALIKKLRARKFDLVLSHGFDMCPMVLANLMNLRNQFTFITPGTFIMDHLANILGLPVAPAYIPNAMRGSSDRMPFMERVKNAFIYGLTAALGRLLPSLFWDEELLLRGPPNNDRPTFDELWQEIPSLFINGEPFLDFPRPLPFGISYLGELSEQTRNNEILPLEKEFIDILEKSEKGTILFSLGTIAKAKHMPVWMRKAFAEAFMDLKGYEIIWRFDEEVPEVVGVPHIHVVKWLPQRDLLNHPKIKLFVTHGGYNSLLEATKAGVPLVMIPLFADQYGNGARAQRHGLGLVLEKMSITKEALLEAMKTVMENEHYTKRAKQLAKTLDDKVIDPGALLDYRVNFLAKKRKQFPTLRKASEKSFIEYNSLDVLSMFLGIILSLSYFLIKILAWCLWIFDKKKESEKARK